MTTPDRFRAFIAATDDGGFRRGVVELGADDLPSDGVLVRVAYSSVNYKDSLAASANGKVARISPLVVGVDLAGEVVESDDPAFSPGDPVVAGGYDLGVSRHGGFAEYARVPANWLVPLPDGLDLEEAMALGTAGYTAALSVLALLDHGLAPGAGPVVVTGATGGVGSVAVSMLGGLGHEVVAVSGKPEASSWLERIGAASVVGREELAETPKPLMPASYAGAVDAVGGDILAGVIARLAPGASVAASGNVGGAALNTTVLPFILRGVNLLGIDSVTTPIEHRREVWRRMATDLRPSVLDHGHTVVPLADVERALDEIARGGVTGRYVVAT